MVYAQSLGRTVAGPGQVRLRLRRTTAGRKARFSQRSIGLRISVRYTDAAGRTTLVRLRNQRVTLPRTS